MQKLDSCDGRRTRLARLLCAQLVIFAVLVCAQSIDCEAETLTKSIPSTDEQRHAFDFLHGSWRVHHHRLRARLAHSSEWEDFDGTVHCWGILGGDGNVDDNVIELPSGTYRASTMRVFDARAGVWRIWWYDARSVETLDPPLVGSFYDGVGTFYSDDSWHGRPIRVRYLWRNASADSARWEQAFSEDGGKTWETNWVMSFDKVR
jgi:hypothetical protein